MRSRWIQVALTLVGLAAAAQQDLEQTVARFEKALKANPNDADAQVGLAIARGLILQRKGQLDQAIFSYKTTIKRHPRSADVYNWLGVAYMQKNALVEAIAALRQAVALKPDFVRAYNNLGSTLAQAGNVREGIEAFRTGLKYAPADLPLHTNLGMALRTAGDTEGATREFENALRYDSSSPELRHQLGQTLRQKGDLQGAIREFTTALDTDPELQETYYGLGQTLRQIAASQPTFRSTAQYQADLKEALETARNQNLRLAIDQLTKIVLAYPESGEARFHLGAALWYSGDRAKAAEMFEEALKLAPASVEATSFRGVTYREAGELAAARSMFYRVIALSPKAPSGYVDLAVVMIRMNLLDKAVGQFEAALNLPNASPIPDAGSAIRELRKAAQANPKNAELQNVLGRLLGSSGGDQEEIIASFQSALRIKPDFAEASNNLGLVYTQLGEDEKAAAAFRQAIAIQPNYADALANLGALLTASDAVASVEYLERALTVQPTLLKARYNLALAYGSSPRYGTEREIAQLRKVVETDPSFPRAQFALGKALLRKGDVAEGVKLLEAATRLDPQFGEAHYQLGLGLARLGRSTESTAEVQKGRELISANQRSQTLQLDMAEGKRAIARQDWSQAVGTFQRVIASAPDFPEAHYQLGVALNGNGDRDGAIAAFQKTLTLDPNHTGAKEDLTKLSQVEKGDDPFQLEQFEKLIRSGAFQEAESQLAAYVQQRPKSSRGWYALGYSLFGQHKMKEAIGALAKSLQINVRNAEAHVVLGRCLMMIGRFDAAQVEFEQAAKYSPRSGEPLYNLGKLLSIQDHWNSAKAAFEEALRRDPEYMEAFDGLGFALDALAEDEAAIANYRKSIERNEARKAGFVSPYVNLSAHYNRTGDQALAIDYARQAIAINANSDRAWFQLGKAQISRSELEPAAESLSRAVAINSRSASYFYVLAGVYRRLGKLEESQAAMQSFRRLDRESNKLEEKRREAQQEAEYTRSRAQPNAN